MSYFTTLAPHVYDALANIAAGDGLRYEQMFALESLGLLDRHDLPGAILFVLSDDGRKALKERSTK